MRMGGSLQTESALGRGIMAGEGSLEGTGRGHSCSGVCLLGGGHCSRGGVSPQGAAAECTYWGSPLKLCSGVGMWGCHPGTLQLGTHGGGHPWGCSGRGSLTMQS